MKNPVLRAISLVVLLCAFAAGIGMYSSSYYQNKMQAEPQIQGMLWPNPKTLRPFASIDHKGNVFGLDQLTTKWTFMFFGYTHCPDICPVTMSQMNQLHALLVEQDATRPFQVAFMTVDPDRDSTEKLATYVEYFNKEFIGLGGNMSQVESLTRQIGVPHFLAEKNENGDYLVEHSASIFLIDPEGRLVAIFSSPHDINDIAERFTKISQFISKQS